jgi:hypothetical protein
VIVHQAQVKDMSNWCNVIDCLLIDPGKEITILENTLTRITVIFTLAPWQVSAREEVENQAP